MIGLGLDHGGRSGYERGVRHVVRSTERVAGRDDRLTADPRRPDHGDPVLPFLRRLGLVVGVQEQLTAHGHSPC
jgi:hypothetical protein